MAAAVQFIPRKTPLNFGMVGIDDPEVRSIQVENCTALPIRLHLQGSTEVIWTEPTFVFPLWPTMRALIVFFVES